MIIKDISVKNFRCLREATLPCDPLTVLVGPNGAGKSSFLRALDLSFNPSANYTEDDFFARDSETPIEVSVTFTDLSPVQQEQYASYVRDGTITVVKRMSWPRGRGSQTYHGYRLANLRFEEIRGLRLAGEQRPAYDALREEDTYADLPRWTNQGAVLDAMRQWERERPEACVQRLDDGQFFNVGNGDAGDQERQITYVPVPAVKEAAEVGSEGRGTPLTRLMDLVVREALHGREDFAQLETEARARTDEIFRRAKEEELRRLQEALSADLSRLAVGAEVRLDWSVDGFEIPLPQGLVRLVEGGYPATLPASGHGLQRLFIMALLQRLAEATAPRGAYPEGEDDGAEREVEPPRPSVLLAIEEPELYQHPNRQRSLATVFRRLTRGEIPGVTPRVQVLHTTHSPLFIDVERSDQVRVLRKDADTRRGILATTVTFTTMEELTRELERVWQREPGSFTSEVTRQKLKLLLTPEVSEGFFAERVVLVEGPEDRALIQGYATAHGVTLEDMGISVIACGGKENIARPAVVFSRLGIPVFLVGDNDRGRGRPDKNHRLLHVLGVEPEDFPSGVFDKHAVFDTEAEEVVNESLGAEAYSRLLSEVAMEFDNAPVSTLKFNPQYMDAVFRRAAEEGLDCPMLDQILERVSNIQWV